MASGTKNKVSQMDFILAWETSESVADAAEKLGMSYNAVVARANSYREPRKDKNGTITREGINLKEMPKQARRSRLNVASLNEFIEKIRAGQAAPAPVEAENTAETVENPAVTEEIVAQ